MNEWILESREAKRLFIMGLAALAVRGETGPGDPDQCRMLADKFGALSDMLWFMAGRTSNEELQNIIRMMTNDVLLKMVEDSMRSGDIYTPLLKMEAQKRQLEVPEVSAVPSGTLRPASRKFSFDD